MNQSRNRISRTKRPILGALLFCLACLFVLAGQMAHAQTAPPPVVISQVYGGGGNAGAAYTHDFIELFNRGAEPVSLAGWSVQYASATGTNWQMSVLSGTIPPGGYYLIQQAQGSGGTTPLPAPDAIGLIPMSASSGKVALLIASQLLTKGVACPDGPTLVNLVGFGSADCSAGTAAPGLDNRTAGLRLSGGCANTGSNRDDFLISPPAPRNSASRPTPCAGDSAASAPIGSPRQQTTATLQSLISATQSLTTPVQPLTATTAPVSATADLSDTSPAAGVHISQIYGGGGNAGALYTHDFVELYNGGPGAVDLEGWSLQYASATGKTWLITPLSGAIGPGEFYLIQQAQGAGGSVSMPAPDAVGDTAMSASSGKVALVQDSYVLTGVCPRGELIVDFVGYGGADCFEGGGPGAKTSNTRALVRVEAGGQDTGDNQADFVTAPPLLHRE